MSELGRVVTELQVKGLRDGSLKGNRGRRGGAGPSDHRALELDGTTVMVPIYNDASSLSPYSLDASGDGVALNGPRNEALPAVTLPAPPNAPRRLPRDSAVVPTRMPSSSATIRSSPLRLSLIHI